MKLYTILVFITVVLLVIACQSETDVSSYNSLTAPVDTLKKVLEIGKEFGDSSEVFSSINAAIIDDQNRIIVLDEIENCLKIFDIEGNYTEQVSRRGSGPGEFNHPRGLFSMADGRLGVCSSGRGGYVVFDDSLDFIEEFNLWHGNSPHSITPISDSLFIACRYGAIQRNNLSVNMRTVGIYKWGESDCKMVLWGDSLVLSIDDFSEDPSPLIRYALIDKLDTSGNSEFGIYFAVSNPYEYCITGWDSCGVKIFSLTREMTPVEKTPDELIDENFYVSSSLNRGTGGNSSVLYQAQPYRNMIVGVYIGPDNNLWVRRGTYTEPFFDIYDLDGNLLRHVVYPVDGWSWKTEISPNGILAWELDPKEGYQKLYLLE